MYNVIIPKTLNKHLTTKTKKDEREFERDLHGSSEIAAALQQTIGSEASGAFALTATYGQHRRSVARSN